MPDSKYEEHIKENAPISIPVLRNHFNKILDGKTLLDIGLSIKVFGTIIDKVDNKPYSIKDDDGNSISIGYDSDLLSPYVDEYVGIIATPSISNHNNGFYLNLKAIDVIKADKSHNRKNSNWFDNITHVFDNDNINNNFYTKVFPDNIKRIMIVTSNHKESSSAEDINRYFSEENINKYGQFDIIRKEISIQSENELASVINEAQNNYVNVLLIARGGGDIANMQAFNSLPVLTALNAFRGFRILAVGHSRHVTLADFFADARLITPTDAGNYLNIMLWRSQKLKSNSIQQSRIRNSDPDTNNNNTTTTTTTNNNNNNNIITNKNIPRYPLWLTIAIGILLGVIIGKFLL